MTSSSVPRPPPPARFYVPELDGLRFFAFLAVFLFHALQRDAWPDAGGITVIVASVVRAGAFGVDLFFLLSSFLITSLLLREHAQTGKLDLRNFWIRRCLRIWPLYFTFVGLVGFLLPRFVASIGPLSQPLRWGLLTFTHNWVAAFVGLGTNPTLVLWSVSLEEQFYLVWPLILLLLGIHGLRRLAFILIGLASVFRCYAIYRGANWDMLWCATPLRMEPIALGALLALGDARLPKFRPQRRYAMLGGGMVVPVIFYCLAGPSPWWNAALFPAVTMACGLIFLAVRGAPWRWLRNERLTYLGKISYGLYVYHWLALKLAERVRLPGLPLGRTLIAFGLTVILAAVSYRFLESPFLKLKDRFAHIHSRPV